MGANDYLVFSACLTFKPVREIDDNLVRAGTNVTPNAAHQGRAASAFVPSE